MTTQRGLSCLAGAALAAGTGAPLWHRGIGDDVIVTLRGDSSDSSDSSDRRRVRDALALLDDGAPTLFLLSYEACVALDARAPRKPRDGRLGPDVLVRRLERVPAPAPLPAPTPPRVRAPDDAARERHMARVRTARARLLDGVIYQANLAHRLAVAPATHDEGLAFFLDATGVTSEAAPRAPPCAAFVDVPGWGSVISLSPERFLKRMGGAAHAYPIKGTRPRGATADDDARLLRALCTSEKDAAEHVMIVDLLRNDLGKVAVAGGVTVDKLLEVVSVKNVHHLESTITAALRDDVTTSALLAATVPGGSITGAPKSSAIDVIHELEDGPRGLYTGVLGVVERRRVRSALLIRTWLRPDDGEGSLHVGGGIVVDSDPAMEWRETLDKARAFD